MATPRANVDPHLYGLLAQFEGPDQLIEASHAARNAGYRNIEAYSPFPVHGLAAAVGHPRTRLPYIVLAGGIVGCLTGFFLQYYTSVFDYPVNTGGKPFNAWPAFVVIMFELTVLFAGLSAVLGMLLLNGLPMPHHPLFNVPEFELASRTHFFLSIKAVDPRFEIAETTRFLNTLRPTRVYVVPQGKMLPPSPAAPPPPHEVVPGSPPGAGWPNNTATKAGLLLVMLLLPHAGGCDNVNQEIDDEGRLEVYEPSAFFADQQSVRPLAEGTVARGQARVDDHLYRGKVDGRPAETFPAPVTRRTLERGRQRYEIYCAPCHNSTGDGDGMIVQRGFTRPPSLHDPRLKAAPVGHYFDVITNGWGAMYGYADRVNVEDRWAIAAYIRVLQLSQGAELASLPEPDRQAYAQGIRQQDDAAPALVTPQLDPDRVLQRQGSEDVHQ